MSKSALYKGLGAATGMLAEGMFADNQRRKDFAAQSALDTAQARREASLKALEREWDVADREDRQAHDLTQIGARAEADLEKSRRERENEINNPTPYEQARLAGQGALNESRTASAEASRARASYIGTQQEAFENEMTAGGGTDLTAYERNLPHRVKVDIRNDATQQAKEYFRSYKDEPLRVETIMELHPELAKQAKITEKTPLHEAQARVRELIFRSEIQRYGQDFGMDSINTTGGNQGGRQPAGGKDALLGEVINAAQPQMQRQQPLQQQQGAVVPPMGTMPGAGQQRQPQGAQGSGIVNQAMQAIQRGAPPEAVIQRMREMGAGEQEIQALQQALGNVR